MSSETASEENKVPRWEEGKIYLSPEDETTLLSANETIIAPGVDPMARYQALKTLDRLAHQNLVEELRVLRLNQMDISADVAKSPEGQKIQQRIVDLETILGQRG
jgi:hypothetical protein